MKAMISAAAAIGLMVVAGHAIAQTPAQNRAFDEAIQGTTMTRCPPELKCSQPPITPARPDAPYSGWSTKPFGNGDPFRTDRGR